MTSWPTTFGPTVFPSSSTIQSSVFGMAIPTLVGFRARSSGGRYVQRLHSVRPYIEKIRAVGKVRWRKRMCFTGSAAAVFVTMRTRPRS